jgi:uncharacterized membrane protein
MFVHFPTALYPGALLLAIVGRVQSEPAYGRAAAVLVAFGVAMSLGAAGTGFLDWLGMVRGSTKRRVATRHMILQVGALALAAAALASAVFGAGYLSSVTLALLGGAIVLLSVGNWFGGVLVYRMGMRVGASPTTKDHAPTKAEAA